ncbi:cupin domain-containing protein [Nocardioides limicola]|uniref:cupin domain-containing protein n=1 Tax=Nocardioides limicola TaxID=2803368 RepID=UPI0035578B84
MCPPRDPDRQAAGPATYSGRFTGEVQLEMLDDAAEAAHPDIARVSFGGDAVTYWHSHPGGQRLLVLDGRAVVGTEESESTLGPGDFVVTPPGERHYHGAADSQGCQMLAITWGTTDWESSAPPITAAPKPGETGSTAPAEESP